MFQPIKIRNDFQKIIDLKPDYIVTAAYGQILPRGLIDNVHSINIHASLLPLYRGGAPIQKSIMNLDKETGISIMKMEYKMDSGDVYYQESIPIKDVDTTTSLTKKLSILGSEMILEYLNNPKNIHQFRKMNQKQHLLIILLLMIKLLIGIKSQV